MNLLKLVIARPLPRKGQAEATGDTPKAGVGVFVTAQSLATFPVASMVVTLIWKFTAALWPAAATYKWIPLLAALLIGAVIFLGSISEPTARPQSGIQWFVTIAVAIINSLFLAAAALGILDAVTSGSGGSPTTGTPPKSQ